MPEENIKIIEGKYRVIKQIGGETEDGRKLGGAMSNVYKVEDIETGRTWALKEYRNSGARTDRANRSCLKLEAETLKSLRHRAIPAIVDVIEKEDGFIIVEDYVNGKNLDKMLKATDNGLPLNDVIGWMLQLCDVLIYLHSQDPPIIYRDLKPENIMLKTNGDIRLVDFGSISEYADNGRGRKALVQTEGYAAPEQMAASKAIEKKAADAQQKINAIDQRSDIFALAITMYRLLTRESPKSALTDLMNDYRDIGSDGIMTILKCCAADNPEYRIQSVKEFRWALRHYQEYDRKYIRKQKIRKNICFGTGAAGIMTTAAGAVLTILQFKDIINMGESGYVVWLVIAAGLLLVLVAGILFYAFRIRQSMINQKKAQVALDRHKAAEESDDEEFTETRMMTRAGVIDTAYEEMLVGMGKGTASSGGKKIGPDDFVVTKSSVYMAASSDIENKEGEEV